MGGGAKFLTVVDTFAGYCQVCHDSRVVGRIEVAGWQYHGLICSHCLRELADEVQRRGRGRGLTLETAASTEAVAAMGRRNGQARWPVTR